LASVHLAAARRLEPARPAPPGLLPSATVRLDLSALEGDCGWMTDRVSEQLALSAAGIPVRLDLACSRTNTLEPAVSFTGTYVEIEQRRELGEVPEKRWVTESYPCTRIGSYWDGNGNYVSAAVISYTCTRDVEETTMVPGNVWVPYEVERTGTGTRQARRLWVGLGGAVTVGSLPALPYLSEQVIQETAVDNVSGADVPFTDRTLATIEVLAVTELVTAVRGQLVALDAARDEAYRTDALRLADAPSPERDEAFAGALLAGSDPPAAVAWLAAEFGLAPDALRALLH
ncbi:MAG: hypothetical protein Q8P41_31000, partial [Pseudomonadota bacterium]|nr:hypothetical protein [Pseudomonadota bacterium]